MFVLVVFEYGTWVGRYVGMHLPTTSIRIWHSKRMRQRLKRSTTFVLKIHLKIDKARDKFTFERSCDVWPIDS